MQHLTKQDVLRCTVRGDSMNDYREYSDYLMHYGVKGMKWHDHRYAEEPIKSGFRSVAVNALATRRQRQQAQDEQRRRQAQAHQQQLALNAQRQRAQANAPTSNTSTDDGHQNGSESREDFLTNLMNELQGKGDNLQNVGNAFAEMIENGNYWGAFGYYKSLDMETRDLLNKRIMNHELPEALGNGNIEEGKRRVEIGQKIANFLLSNPIHQYNSRTLGALTGGEIGTGTTSTIRRNEEAKDFRNARRRK